MLSHFLSSAEGFGVLLLKSLVVDLFVHMKLFC